MALQRLYKNKKALGADIEDKARHFLEKQRLKFVTKNYTKRIGELDLVMLDKDILVFVEVRYRGQTSYQDALSSVDQSKQKKLIKLSFQPNSTLQCEIEKFD